MTHVAILGGGPAGLAAAQGALAAGARVSLLDEGDRLGGQFWRHHERLTDPRLQHAWHRFGRLRGALADGDAQVHVGASVWWAEASADGVRLRATVGDADGDGRTGLEVDADAVVVATGAHDLALPVPGWTLPGVTTAGAAQALAKRDGVAVGRRTVVSGSGPFLLPVAHSLALVGSEVVAVHEASRLPALARGWLPRPWELAGKAEEFLEYAGGLMRHRIPYRTGSAVVRVLGTDRVEGVVVAAVDADWRPIPGTEREVACDAVALGHGFTPRLEAALALGCAIDGDHRGRFVVVDDTQRTSVARVFAAGELTGIAGADAALAEGAVAGFLAAGGAFDDPRLRGPVAARSRTRAFARRLERAHGIRPGWTAWLDDDTIVCRCEAVARRAIVERADVPLRAMRLATRAGLGPCQGRTCGRTVEAIVAEAGGAAASVGFDRRPVLAPVRIGEVAALAETDPPT
ncbi:pyridine nucleotide-disulfide oxidoreductase [Agromyces luteolus]|uniref:FAD-dependent oxidoreductase n=1 Tax=Agromyces luteolus TaxID=88373 RepID=A0A7C9M0N3_9MICO|nr:FAD/NAD(P)-binding oxidoreductase [Agromyces luteolus]MUN08513.1 FAD-dependent oxidoreductase [Agromyces luteolus]GLK27047.1 pyridine nucleotide-disulfide oxidoreductase [Agromyces luteolus]